MYALLEHMLSSTLKLEYFYAKVRVLGVRVDEDTCMRCARCVCQDSCPIGVDWEEIIRKEKWITPDYCIICMTCANVCPFGAIYAWRVH